MDRQFENLAFEGGGVKGVAYAGVLQVLEQKNILPQIQRVAGTSAGAITSCLVSLRYSASTITNTIKGLDLGSFDDKEGLLKKLHYYGLHPGDTFLKWIKEKIAAAGLGLDENATFKDFQKAGCCDLRVFATNIYLHNLQEFSFRETPDTIVAEAVRASMSIPLFFNAWKFSNDLPNDHLYVDGGVLYNYPISAFDEEGTNQQTLGFRLEDVHGKMVPKKFGYGHWIQYVKNTFDTLLQAQTIDFNKDPEQVSRTVVVDDLGISATDFDISDQMKNELIEQGKKATEAFLG